MYYSLVRLVLLRFGKLFTRLGKFASEKGKPSLTSAQMPYTIKAL